MAVTRKSVFTIFAVVLLLGCALLLISGIQTQEAVATPDSIFWTGLSDFLGMPLLFCGLGGMLVLPVMGKASRRARRLYRIFGLVAWGMYLAAGLIPDMWITASWISEYPAVFLAPGVCLALGIPGKSPTAGKYAAKKEKKKKEPPEQAAE